MARKGRDKPVPFRTIKVNRTAENMTARTNKSGCCPNAQNLSRYNGLTFLPKFLLEQFSQLSNIYFLIIALLQQLPDLSPTGRWGTVSTLAVLMALSAVKVRISLIMVFTSVGSTRGQSIVRVVIPDIKCNGEG